MKIKKETHLQCAHFRSTFRCIFQAFHGTAESRLVITLLFVQIDQCAAHTVTFDGIDSEIQPVGIIRFQKFDHLIRLVLTQQLQIPFAVARFQLDPLPQQLPKENEQFLGRMLQQL